MGSILGHGPGLYVVYMMLEQDKDQMWNLKIVVTLSNGQILAVRFWAIVIPIQSKA
jgi:hypothetical protein